jgi:hypothetical protein
MCDLIYIKFRNIELNVKYVEQYTVRKMVGNGFGGREDKEHSH